MNTETFSISIDEYRDRRQRVLESLGDAAGVVFAGTETPSSYPLGRWKTDRFFWYLTGLDYESGAAILFDPAAEDPQRRITLFLRSRDPEIERWDGPRSPLDSALKAKTGFAALARGGSLPGRLTDAARRTKRLACLHPFTSYNLDLSPDFAVFKKVCEHVPGVAIEDRTQVLPGMRAVKSPAELALIERAIAVSAAALAAALPLIRPGVSEKAVADALTDTYREHGAEARLRLHRRVRAQRCRAALRRSRPHHPRRRPDRHRLWRCGGRLRLRRDAHAARERHVQRRTARALRSGAARERGGDEAPPSRVRP